MKLTKTLFLGSAAGLMAVSGALAADLPVKAKAIEYVKICSLYGAGYYYIPGSDTCIKLGGYLRAEVALGTNSVYGAANGATAGSHNRLSNYYTARARQDLNIDTRTATEYGVVRTFFDATFSWTTGNYTGQGSATGATGYSATTSGTSTVNPTDGGTSGGSVGVYYAFIQFAGFTMGKAVSQFDAPWTNYPGNNFDGLVGGSGTVTGVLQGSYTADFGQGVTASFSVEDATAYYQAGNLNMSGASVAGIVGGSYGSNDVGGSRSPNLVGQVRVDQAWGLFQASVAAKDNHVAYYGATEATGHPDDKWGWAIQLALSIKNIPTGAGDTINISGVYTDGATRYNFQNLAGSSYSMYGSSSSSYGSVGFANAPDTVFVTGSQQESVKTWGFRGAYTHNWNPNWNTALYGAYAGARFGTLAKNYVCGGGGYAGVMNVAGVTSCNPDFNVAQLGVITRWTPVKNLTFSADLTWTHLDQKYAGTVTVTPAASYGKPTATYELKDQNSLTMLLRAQRNW
ncbi:porin [Bradyrhizobium sp. CCBAU 25338]|uniref:porin n=1 Tax=Bradyrhizobium sp. CCBAU 25338 TaxID=1641877 RepID=UPI0023039BCE|nr:porin [Bradyrhizobium sp. CCBAU 25338]MDA9532372.1 polymerase [Bradyrhizobium sp. CCBAU 25338]